MTLLHSESIILFLDFDGVTHTDKSPVDELFSKMSLIEDVLYDYDDVSIVISSSWRESYSLSDMREFFDERMQHRVIGVTPIAWGSPTLWLPGLVPEYEREWECHQWLLENKHLIDVDEFQVGEPTQLKWIAIDDRPYWFSPNCLNLLTVDPVIGFGLQDQPALHRMLKAREQLEE